MMNNTRKRNIRVHTIGAKNKAASAILEVTTTFGWYFSRQWTIGAAPKYVLIPFTYYNQIKHTAEKKVKWRKHAWITSFDQVLYMTVLMTDKQRGIDWSLVLGQ